MCSGCLRSRRLIITRGYWCYLCTRWYTHTRARHTPVLKLAPSLQAFFWIRQPLIFMFSSFLFISEHLYVQMTKPGDLFWVVQWFLTWDGLHTTLGYQLLSWGIQIKNIFTTWDIPNIVTLKKEAMFVPPLWVGWQVGKWLRSVGYN